MQRAGFEPAYYLFNKENNLLLWVTATYTRELEQGKQLTL